MSSDRGSEDPPNPPWPPAERQGWGVSAPHPQANPVTPLGGGVILDEKRMGESAPRPWDMVRILRPRLAWVPREVRVCA